MVAKTKTTKKKSRQAPSSRLSHHVTASLVSIAPHHHTGKRVGHRHTSHGAIFAVLILTGMLLFANLGVLRAFGATMTSGGAVKVSVNVAGAPPSQGATITFPTTNSITTVPLLQVQGECPDGTLVSLYNNGGFAGSTICTNDGSFSLTLQLTPGINVLAAQNYDGLNQAGPSTPQVIISYNRASPPPATTDITSPSQPVTKPTELTQAPQPLIAPVVPKPSANPCFNPSSPSSMDSSIAPVIIVSCIQRNVYTGERFQLPVIIKDGLSPFALAVDWGEGSQPQLIAITDHQPKTLEYTYATAGFHQVTLRVSDSNGQTSQIQTVVSVDGPASASGGSSPINQILQTAKKIWIEAPVPLYIAIVTLALGFWVGDVFQRFVAIKQQPKIRSAVRH